MEGSRGAGWVSWSLAGLFALPGVAILAHQATVPAQIRSDTGLYFEFAGMTLGRPSRAEYLRWKTHPVGEPPMFKFTTFDRPQVPYRDFEMEYPPGALPLFVLPRLVTDDFATFAVLFQLMMAAAVAGTAVLTWRIAVRLAPEGRVSPWKAALIGSASAYGFSLLMVQEYDAATVVVVAGAILAALNRRWSLAGLLLGLGGAVKLWPLLLVPPLAMRIWADGRLSALWRPMLAAAAGMAVPHAILAVFAGPAVLDYLRYHAERGLHMESTLGNLVVVVGLGADLPVWTQFEFGTYHVHTDGWADGAGKLSGVLLLAGYTAALVVAGRTLLRTKVSPAERDRMFIAGCLMVLTVAMAAAKVLSVQYLMWLAPLAVVLPGRRGALLAAGYAAMPLAGRLIFFNWGQLQILALGPHLLVLARNAGLLALAIGAARYCRGLAADAETAPVESPDAQARPRLASRLRSAAGAFIRFGRPTGIGSRGNAPRS